MLYPMLAMVALTFVVLLTAFLTRMQSVRSGRVRLSSYRLLDKGDLPSAVMKPTRNYANLFEMPVLFYAACLTAMQLGLAGETLVLLGWGYVLFRILHSLIHLSYNNVMHRLTAFMLSNICLLGIWGLIAYGVL